MTDALVDNDIILKTCRYGFDAELLDVLQEAKLTVGALPFARYVIRTRLRRGQTAEATDFALSALARTMARLDMVEPDEEEIRIAAAYEAAAQKQNLELDSGESQLLAILVNRGLKLLLTGDKRAIRAIENLACGQLPPNSVGCLEQFIATLVGRLGLETLRQRVCSEPSVDRALTTCFACHAVVVDPGTVKDGLHSYIEDVRKSARRILVRSNDLSSLIA